MLWQAKHRALVHPRATFITHCWAVWPWNMALWPTPIMHYAVQNCTTDQLHALKIHETRTLILYM